MIALDSQHIEFSSRSAEQEWMRWCSYVIREKDGKLIIVAGEVFAKYTQFLILERGVPEWSAFDEGYEVIMTYTCANGAMLQRAFDILLKCWKYAGPLSVWNDFRGKEEIKNFQNANL